MTHRLSDPYQLDESTFVFRGIRSDFSFLFHFSMKFMKANRITPDWTPPFAGSHLGLFCLPISHKMDVRLIDCHVKIIKYIVFSSGSFCQIYRITDEALIAETAVWPNFSF